MSNLSDDEIQTNEGGEEPGPETPTDADQDDVDTDTDDADPDADGTDPS